VVERRLAMTSDEVVVDKYTPVPVLQTNPNHFSLTRAPGRRLYTNAQGQQMILRGRPEVAWQSASSP